MSRTSKVFGLVLGGLTLAFGLAVSVGRVDAQGERKASRPAPELTGVSTWINSEPLSLKDLRGKVVVVHFWTHGCINCIHNYPHYRDWQARYEGKDVVILGIHTPEFPSEKEIARIRSEAEKNGLKFPIAVDNDAANWRAWGNRYWPSVYLVDRRGRVREMWEGELNWNGRNGADFMRRRIDSLLAERA